MHPSSARAEERTRNELIPVPLLLLLVCGGYFLSAKAGQALGQPVVSAAPCWPAQAVLLAGMLLAPAHCWWRIALAALPAHLLVQLADGAALAGALAAYARNCLEALTGAAAVAWALRARLCFDDVRHAVVFLLACTLLAPVVAALPGLLAGAAGPGWFAWQPWAAGVLFDGAAVALLAPVLVGWSGIAAPHRAPLARHLEGATIAVLLLGVGGAVFVYGTGHTAALLLLYASLPVLLWAAIRFGPFGAAAGLLLLACLALSGTALGQGPFAAHEPAGPLGPLPLLLAGLAAPLLLLGAALADARAARRVQDGRQHLSEPRAAVAPARLPGAWRDSGERQAPMADAIPQVLWAARADGQVEYANRHWRVLAGGPVPATADELWAPYLCDSDAVRFGERWRRAQDEGEPFEAECRFRFPGQPGRRWYLARAWPLRDARGRIERWCGAWTDIDEHKQAQLAQDRVRVELERQVALRSTELRQASAVLRAELARGRRARAAGRVSEARFARVFRASPVAMALSGGPDGVIRDVNDSWQELFGYRRADAIGKSPRELRLFDDEAAPSGTEVAPWTGREARMRRRDGAALDIVLRGARIDNEPDGCFITILCDETGARRREAELRRQREQLIHLSRVVVLGELCGAIAHELNQPLAAILANAQAGRRWLARQPEAAPLLAEILDDIVASDHRAAVVIRRLRTLFEQGETTLRPLDIAKVVREALVLAAASLAEHQVVVAADFDERLGVVRGDPVQLQQVLLNLVVNACEALGATPRGERRLDIACRALAGEAVELVVTDSGPGFAAGVLDKVFDSFFTTKPHGLGFGLSVSRAIVVAHGGRIEAANRAGGGAVFRITLPVKRE